MAFPAAFTPESTEMLESVLWWLVTELVYTDYVCYIVPLKVVFCDVGRRSKTHSEGTTLLPWKRLESKSVPRNYCKLIFDVPSIYFNAGEASAALLTGKCDLSCISMIYWK